MTIEDDLDLAAGTFWFVLRVGSQIDVDPLFQDAAKGEGWSFTDQLYSIVDAPTGIDAGDLVDLDGNAVVETVDFMWLLIYPHPHSLVLHGDDPERARCIDLADERFLSNPNQHNAVHIGVPGQFAFTNAGHTVAPWTCEDAPS